jgi:predicted DNA-binding transcriptional regulator AlpA
MRDTIHGHTDQLLTEAQTADFLNVSIRSLQAWRVRGGGPIYAKLGRSVRYRRSDLDAHIEESLTSSTSVTGAAREGS